MLVRIVLKTMGSRVLDGVATEDRSIGACVIIVPEDRSVVQNPGYFDESSSLNIVKPGLVTEYFATVHRVEVHREADGMDRG